MPDPHAVVPVHLLSDLGRMQAPLLSVYYAGDTPDITLSGTNLVLVDGSTTYTISLGGKSSSTVAGEITKTASSYTARVLFDFADLGSIGLLLDPSDETIDGGRILRANGHIVRRREETRIRLRAPYEEDRHLPWHVVVDRGTLVKTVSGASWFFDVPEYHRQVWSPFYGKPYVDQYLVRATRTGPRSISLPRTPLLWERGNLSITIRGNRQPAGAIGDVDVHNGIVYLNADYDEDEPIFSTYTYREDGYIYDGVDLNPTEFHNPAVLDRFVVFYLLPYSHSGRLRSSTVRHSEGVSLLGALLSIPRQDEPFLVLGAAHVRQVFGEADVSVVDTRTPGGGIRKSRFEKASGRNQEAYSTTDYGHYDGLPYTGSAVVVELGRALQDVFDEPELHSRMVKHAAFGLPLLVEWA